MRNLKNEDLVEISGGQATLRLSPVRVTTVGTVGSSLSQFSGGGGLNLTDAQLTLDPVLVQGQQYIDPSPQDGIEGLRAIENADGTIDFEIETFGYFDVLENDRQDLGIERTWVPGEEGSTDSAYDGGDFTPDEAWDILDTFTPITAPSFV